MSTGSVVACARCGGGIAAGGAYLDSGQRTVCGPCHAKEQFDQIEIASMEDDLAAARKRQRRLIFRVVGIAIGLLLLLLATLGR